MITPGNSIKHNTKIKEYPLAGVQKITVCNKPIFREPGWEPVEEKPFKSKPQKPDAESRYDSARRAKQKVFEIAMLNSFTHFITWTLDKNEIDRYDAAEVSKKLKTFLNNQQKRRKASYIIIPEQHADGAIHMHGLIKGDFDMIDSGKKTKRDQPVYNMPQWKYGFSTAVKLDGNVNAIARYITKYITKDFRKIFGNYYYAGGSLIREAKTVLCDMFWRDVNAPEYRNEVYDIAFKYVDCEVCTEENDNYEENFEVA